MRARSSIVFSIRQTLIKKQYQPHGVQQAVVARWRNYKSGLIVETALRNAPMVTFVYPDGTAYSPADVGTDNFLEMLEQAEKRSARIAREQAQEGSI
jgi:hypothetical protein